jgi:hypothetical protein
MAVFLLGVQAMPALSLDGLYVYFHYQLVAHRLQPEHYFFLPNGRYLRGIPPGEISPASFETACRVHPQHCGSYQISGTTLILTGHTGRISRDEFQVLGPDWVERFGVRGIKVNRPFAANTKLNGRYFTAADSPRRGYEFRFDGSVTVFWTEKGVTPGAIVASSVRHQTGSYVLSGHTLTLNLANQTQRLLVYELGHPDQLLMIDGQPYTRQN